MVSKGKKIQKFGSFEALGGLQDRANVERVEKSYSKKNTSKKPSAFVRKVSPSKMRREAIAIKTNKNELYSSGQTGVYNEGAAIETGLYEFKNKNGASFKYQSQGIDARPVFDLKEYKPDFFKDELEKRRKRGTHVKYKNIFRALSQVSEEVFEKVRVKKSLDNLIGLRKNVSENVLLVGFGVDSDGDVEMLNLKDREDNNKYVRSVQSPVERKYLMLDDKKDSVENNYLDKVVCSPVEPVLETKYTHKKELIKDGEKSGEALQKDYDYYSGLVQGVTMGKIPRLDTPEGLARHMHIQEMKKIEAEAKKIDGFELK